MWHARLDACHQDLEDGAQRDSLLSEVAYRWGFGDAMHFSHAFKRVYGVTPREWRLMYTCQATAPGAGQEGAAQEARDLPHLSHPAAKVPTMSIASQRPNSLAATA